MGENRERTKADLEKKQPEGFMSKEHKWHGIRVRAGRGGGGIMQKVNCEDVV